MLGELVEAQAPVAGVEENAMKEIWLVVRHWPGGRRETTAAFLNEGNAREAAGRMVGSDGAMVALETVNVQDADIPVYKQTDD
jgi:hypothetical protein